MERETIGRAKARALVAENNDVGAVIVCEETGWTVRLVIGASELRVIPENSAQISWQSVDDCLAFVGELGVDRIDLQVDQTSHIGEDPEYDDWIRREVQLAIDDPEPSIPAEEVEQYFAKRRAELRKRIAAG